MTDADFMRLAIQAAWQGLGKGEMPFGACIVRKEQVLSVSHNSAKANIDTTAHAEVQAIREASRQLRMLELAECLIYATCEPCPMCFTLLHPFPVVHEGTLPGSCEPVTFKDDGWLTVKRKLELDTSLRDRHRGGARRT